MKTRFILFVRSGVYYAEDTTTGKQTSLRTKDESEGKTLLNARNEAFRQPVLNLQIARTYLTASNPLLASRTWQLVMDEMRTHGKEPTQKRCARACKSPAFDGIRHKKLTETTSDDFLAIVKTGKVSIIHYLKRFHNLAMSLGWLPYPVLAPAQWPEPTSKPKRGITMDEQKRILAAEKNSERNLYYQLLWETGASQTDAAMLTRNHVDSSQNTLTYIRRKTGEIAQFSISRKLTAILAQLSKAGYLFPKIAASSDNARSAEFYRRRKLLGIEGISLHSYRYAWAERAKTCGYPVRFAQVALGHNSEAVHLSYAKKAIVLLPPLEDYEEKFAAANDNRPLRAVAA